MSILGILCYYWLNDVPNTISVSVMNVIIILRLWKILLSDWLNGINSLYWGSVFAPGVLLCKQHKCFKGNKHESLLIAKEWKWCFWCKLKIISTIIIIKIIIVSKGGKYAKIRFWAIRLNSVVNLKRMRHVPAQIRPTSSWQKEVQYWQNLTQSYRHPKTETFPF